MNNVPTMQDLLEAGVHFGHQVRRGNPRMFEYIFGAREGVHIINLELSEKLLEQAVEAVEKLGAEGKVLLFVGTKKQAQPIIAELAQSANAPYINFKWPGGFLTNFDEIHKNVKKLINLQEQQSKGELSRYTKKEQLLIAKRLQKFNKEFGGIAKLDRLPDAIFIADCAAEKTALTEAYKLQIPVIGICDTNSNPTMVTYPIPGNDDATKSIRILSETIARSYEEGLKKFDTKVSDKTPKSDEIKKAPIKDEVKIQDSPIDEEVAAVEELVEKEEVKDSKVEA